MQIAICDDELIFAETLQRKIQKEFARYNESCSFITVDSGEKLIKLCSKEKVDVVFLDIAMPQLNGFETAARLREIRKNVILVFVSSKNDTVYSSYEYNPIWFIPKSQMNLLGRAVDKIIEKKQALEGENRIIQLKLGNRMMEIDPKEVIYIKVEGHYAKIVSRQGVIFDNIRCKLKELESQLEFSWFVRVHNSYLVNLSLSRSISFTDITMCNGERIPISRSKIGYTKEKFQDYLRSIR